MMMKKIWISLFRQCDQIGAAPFLAHQAPSLCSEKASRLTCLGRYRTLCLTGCLSFLFPIFWGCRNCAEWPIWSLPKKLSSFCQQHGLLFFCTALWPRLLLPSSPFLQCSSVCLSVDICINGATSSSAIFCFFPPSLPFSPFLIHGAGTAVGGSMIYSLTGSIREKRA